MSTSGRTSNVNIKRCVTVRFELKSVENKKKLNFPFAAPKICLSLLKRFFFFESQEIISSNDALQCSISIPTNTVLFILPTF